MRKNYHSYLFEDFDANIHLSEITMSNYELKEDNREINIANTKMNLKNKHIYISYLRFKKDKENSNFLLDKPFHYFYFDRNENVIFFNEKEMIKDINNYFSDGAVIIGETNININNRIITIFYVKNNKVKHFGN